MSIRMRQTHSKTRKRRSHHGLKEPRLSKCPNCGAYHVRHRMCENCGQYRGRVVVDMTAKLEKKEKKLKQKQMEAEQMGQSEEAEKRKAEREGLSAENLSQK